MTEDLLHTPSHAFPDTVRLQRYRQHPQRGPQVLFFSGGSALNGLARELKQYTHNSIHLVTPFDSGGSSAVIREYFDMPAVGDLRSRLMALADESVLGHPDILRLFEYRLPTATPGPQLRERLALMVSGDDELTRCIAEPMRSLICEYLGCFSDAMPQEFDLRGASIGNLVLVGGYLLHDCQLDPIVALFCKLVNVQGMVRTITDENYHLAVELADGTQIIGQHRLTGKETQPIQSRVKALCLSSRRTALKPVVATLKAANRNWIQQAQLICYPPGSFYSSLAANLLPHGVAQAIADNPAAKVYIPNRGLDPEQYGMSLTDQIETLLALLQKQLKQPVAPTKLLNFVMLDSRGQYPQSAVPVKRLASLGIRVIDTSLVNHRDDPVYDSSKLAQAIMSLV